MTTTLYLYKETSLTSTNTKPVKFPGDGDNWAAIADYKYSATRMSSAPNITATLKWPSCLDDEWSTNVFVNYNGERFFVKNTPSSSYDNTSCLYSHSLELVSERAILDSIYFLNVPTTTSGDGDNPQGDSLSDTTEFAFSGDIHEFVDRLNKSLKKTGVGGLAGYSVVVDRDVTSDTKLFSISNQYVTDVLKSAYELYEVPYYFVGKVIHFGNQQNIISTPPLEYGAKKSLLSISKSNSNKQVVTRITGHGSERNIPYYYPNPTPKGKLKLEGTASSKFEIADQLAFSSNIELDFPIIYKHAEGNFGPSIGTPITDSEYSEMPVTEAVVDKTFYFSGHDIVYKLEFTCDNQSGYLPDFVPIALGIDSFQQQASWTGYFLSGEVRSKSNGAFLTAITVDADLPYLLRFEKHPSRRSGLLTYTIFFRGPKIKRPVYISAYSSPMTADSFSFNSYKVYKATTGVFEADVEVIVSGASGRGHVYSMPTMYVDGVATQDTIGLFKSGELYNGDSVLTHLYVKDGKIYFGKLAPGTYHIKSKFTLPTDASLTNIDISYSTIKYYFWEVVAKGKDVDVYEAGLKRSSFSDPLVTGDTLIQKIDYRIDVKTALMPSAYRRSRGSNMWYNAINSENRGEWYGDIVFDNVYDNRHPVEYIHTDEEIYPTIKGVKNEDKEYIDTFLDIAFDRDDNNEIYPDDYEDENLAGSYKHPYFFAKLKKTNGDNGFNLFDHAIEGETMKISFTTGHVAGCEFEIGVDEDTQKNPVQVDENGDLVRDDDGNVVIRGGFNERQQDTRKNEVWIALKKEDSTMGVMMPDAINQLVPLGDLLVTGEEREGGGDKFVILGIQLPDAYITVAEDRLEQELIKYLKENNRERFSFSLKLSSIFLAKNSKLASTLNENSRVTLVYNGAPYTMYVTSYSLAVKESSALPEVTISINDELKVVKPKVKDIATFIGLTDNKIKDVKRESTTIKAQALSATVASKENAENIRILQEMLANVDLSSLAGQVLENTANINILDRRVTVAILDEDYDHPEQASFMYGLRRNEVPEQDENNDATITLVNGVDNEDIYVVNDNLVDTYEYKDDYTELIIEDAIIVEEIIDCEIIYNNEDDTQNVILADGEDETVILTNEEDTTSIKVSDDDQGTTIINEDDGQTTITNC